jgi:hypothetical protein
MSQSFNDEYVDKYQAAINLSVEYKYLISC